MLGRFIAFLVGVVVTCAGAVLAIAFIPGAAETVVGWIDKLG